MSPTPTTIATTPTVRYQEGSLDRARRAKGPDVWVYRWREHDPETGRRVHRKRIIGTVAQFRTQAEAKRAIEPLREEINKPPVTETRKTVEQLWEDFKEVELKSTTVDRSPTTIDSYVSNMNKHILPQWGRTAVDDVKAPAVEAWLEGLQLAPGTKSKLRNQLAALFSHAVRHEWISKENPIWSVRQSAKRKEIPDILTLDEIKAIIRLLDRFEHRLMVLIAATTALRRSEIRGVRWEDIDFKHNWLNLRTGVVRKHQTKLKTEASAKGVPLPAELIDLLWEWRGRCCYRTDGDWVFASPDMKGKQPVWLETVMRVYIKPAVKEAGISKKVAWHTFRRSLASILGAKKEDVKVVQELLRHSSPAITQGIYQQAEADAKRAAQGHVGGLFLAAL